MQLGLNTLDRYILRQTVGTLIAVLAVVMSLMTLEHLPRLVELTRYSGQAGTVIGHTLLGLLPEYAGIGTLFGLYLAVALTVRRLSLRGELDAIAAAGIGTARLMRMPALLALVIMVFLLVDQGWLIPHGERSIELIGDRMAAGEFGYKVQPFEAVDLGEGRTLTFENVTSDGRRVRNLMLIEGSKTFSASSGIIASMGGTAFRVSMNGGHVVDADAGTVMKFNQLEFSNSDGTQVLPMHAGSAAKKTETLPELLSNGDLESWNEASARLLWPAMIPITCALAFYLGQTPRRSATALALLGGIVLLVGFLKSITFVAGYSAGSPGLPALTAFLVWLALLYTVSRGFVRWGPGFVDQFLLSLYRRSARR